MNENNEYLNKIENDYYPQDWNNNSQWNKGNWKMNVLTWEKETNPYIGSIMYISLFLLSLSMWLWLYEPFKEYMVWTIKPFFVIMWMLSIGTYLLTLTRTKLDGTAYFIFSFLTILYLLTQWKVFDYYNYVPYIMIIALLLWLIGDFIYPYIKDFTYFYQKLIDDLKILKAKSTWISKKYWRKINIVEKKTIIRKETNIIENIKRNEKDIFEEDNTDNIKNNISNTFLEDDLFENEIKENIIKEDEYNKEIIKENKELNNISIGDDYDIDLNNNNEQIDLLWDYNDNDWFWILTYEDSENIDDEKLFENYFKERWFNKTLSIIENNKEYINKNYYFIKNN